MSLQKTYSPNGDFRDSDGNHLFGTVIRETFKQSAVTVSNTATLIPATALAKRNSILITNNGGNAIYIGASDVTTANGFPLHPRAVVQIDIQDNVDIYGITASGTVDIRIVEGT